MNIKLITILLLISTICQAQITNIEGYVYEANNRGYLNEVQVELINPSTSEVLDKVWTNQDGHFKSSSPNQSYNLRVVKDLFHIKDLSPTDATSREGDKHFYKIELKRKPGYFLDITFAEKRDTSSENVSVDAITNLWIEIYNNTTEELLYENKSFGTPNFGYTLTKDNHYTFMLRKEGYLTKRIEAYVNVKGCILCIEGLDKLTPGVTENITEGNEMGTLLANVEMDRVEKGKTLTVDNLYYEFGKFEIESSMKAGLDQVTTLLRDNPRLKIEIGSHTDSKGLEDKNLALSQKRAIGVRNWLINKADINAARILAYGYGESKLANKCKSNVDCTEAEHAENRRTEIKIIGLMPSDDQNFNKSLLDLKHDEHMKKMLIEIQNQEIIEIKEGEELPEEIQKQINANKKQSK